MQTFSDLLKIIFDIFSLVITLFSFVAVGLFFFGLAKFLFSEGDEKALTNGKQLMFWGFVGIFVIFSLWGIVALLSASLFGEPVFGLPQFRTL